MRESVRIREEPNGAVLIDTKSGEYFLASPFEGFILSLFDGTRTVQNITILLKTLKNAPAEREIQNDIYTLIEKRNTFIEIIEKPLKKGNVEVNPYNFLLKTDMYKQPTRTYAPLSVDLYITRRCNLNCVYCFADAEYVGNKIECDRYNEMDFSKISCLIDQIAGLGIRRMTVSGGEPTLRPDLPEIMQCLMNFDMKVFLPTNACLMSDNLAQKLRDLGLKEVQAKLDAANPKTQDKLSRVKGSYTKLIAGIETLKRYSFKVSVVAVVTSWNIKEIPEVIRICVDLGVDEVIPRIYTPGIWAIRGRGGAYLNPSPDSILWLNKEIGNLQEEYGDMKISFLDYSTFQNKKESEIPSCPGLISTCTILENGLLVPCEMLADFSSEFIIGDAKKESLIDIWNSEKAERWALRKMIKVGTPCSSCDEFKRCKGGCPWKSIVAYGTWSGDPFCIRTPSHAKIPFVKIPINKRYIER